MTDLGSRYEEHHREHRAGGDFVFVTERIPLFQHAIGTGKRVLDLGCRSGALTRHFLEGNSVVGLDVDRAALAKAEALGIETVVANVEEPLPLADESFDAVVAGELLEHLRFPDELVAEIRRVLRPGGVLVGSVPNAFNVQNRIRFLRGLPPERDRTHLHMFRPRDLEELLGSFGDVRLAFVGGRYVRLSARLFAQDVVFSAVRP
ncbi:MAG: class I SAM-dependent methyltransferase [Gaiellaceae bacterium]